MSVSVIHDLDVRNLKRLQSNVIKCENIGFFLNAIRCEKLYSMIHDEFSGVCDSCEICSDCDYFNAAAMYLGDIIYEYFDIYEIMNYVDKKTMLKYLSTKKLMQHLEEHG
ncbi:MAG: hypothetical protein ACTSRA_00505 [Promethearchaeota archaeon]